MSDRYYDQMLKANKMNKYDLQNAIKDKNSKEYKSIVGVTKVTRLELSREINKLLSITSSLDKLPKQTLLDILEFSKSGKKVSVNIPEGRLKAPYIKECQKVFGEVDLSSATILSMKEILNAIKE